VVLFSSFSDDLQKVRKKKRPLYMRLEKEFQKKANQLEKEKVLLLSLHILA
jgi:hypothetical protein